MADPLGTLLQVAEVVGMVIDIYHKIQDAPEQIRRIGKRMSRLNTILAQLEVLLRTEEKRALARLGPAMTRELLSVVEDIRSDSEQVKALFVRWNTDVGPLGLQFRFKFAAQAYFALGSSSDKLEALGNDIEDHRQDLRDLLQVMTGFGINQLLTEGGGGQGPSATRKPSPSPSPSPEPEPPRADLNIIFVDPYNTARGVVAEAYTKLLREWTVRTGGDWRVNAIHSAGLFTRSRSEVADLLGSMQFLYASYRLDMADGNAPPQATSLAALFDNKMFNYPYKRDIHAQMQARRSRGVTSTIFKTYDYVLVFTDREEDNMVRLRKLLISKHGKAAATARKKGKVVHLGRYLTSDGMAKEILNPEGNGDGDREQWNKKAAQIKTAVKTFLKKEMGWKQPPKGAKVT